MADLDTPTQPRPLYIKKISPHVTFLLLLQLIWQNDPDMRDQRESEFMEMLARCERTLFKMCLFYTDRLLSAL